jgi:hypothetical protein
MVKFLENPVCAVQGLPAAVSRNAAMNTAQLSTVFWFERRVTEWFTSMTDCIHKEL